MGPDFHALACERREPPIHTAPVRCRIQAASAGFRRKANFREIARWAAPARTPSCATRMRAASSAGKRASKSTRRLSGVTTRPRKPGASTMRRSLASFSRCAAGGATRIQRGSPQAARCPAGCDRSTAPLGRARLGDTDCDRPSTTCCLTRRECRWETGCADRNARPPMRRLQDCHATPLGSRVQQTHRTSVPHAPHWLRRKAGLRQRRRAIGLAAAEFVAMRLLVVAALLHKRAKPQAGRCLVAAA